MTKLRDLVAKWREMGKGCTDYAEGNSLQEDTEVVMNRILGRCADELETALAAHSAAPSERDELRKAAQIALDEMCRTVAPRNSFTDAVDRLDAALSQDKPTVPK